jgi:hypothetical protein
MEKIEIIEIKEIKMKINEKTKSQAHRAEDDDSTRCWAVSCNAPSPGEEEELEIT